MQVLLIGLAIVLFSLLTACSELSLTRSPESISPESSIAEPAATESRGPINQQDSQAQDSQTQNPQTQDPQTQETESEPPAQLVEDLKSVLSVETGIPSYEISFVSAEAVDWPDACLGVHNPDELCAQMITPGYRVILGTIDQQYEVHTDRSGQNIRIKDEE